MSGGELLIYQGPDGGTIDVRLEQDTIWLSLNEKALLFERDKSVISRHLKSIFESEELQRSATVPFFATVQKEGDPEVKRSLEYYNLDAILSVGYRVNSKRGTLFRQWANRVLKEYLIKGYALDEKRLGPQAMQQAAVYYSPVG